MGEDELGLARVICGAAPSDDNGGTAGASVSLRATLGDCGGDGAEAKEWCPDVVGDFGVGTVGEDVEGFVE
eukprot:scaffold14091_cov28-Tisochrysis_lutea.AAC.3